MKQGDPMTQNKSFVYTKKIAEPSTNPYGTSFSVSDMDDLVPFTFVRGRRYVRCALIYTVYLADTFSPSSS